jgi:hypothetical protein
VLQKGFISVPSERLREILGGNARITVLHFVKQALKCERDAAGWCIVLSCGHVVHGLCKFTASINDHEAVCY